MYFILGGVSRITNFEGLDVSVRWKMGSDLGSLVKGTSRIERHTASHHREQIVPCSSGHNSRSDSWPSSSFLLRSGLYACI